MSAFISLIIPSYNRDRYLAEAIESVLAQTYPHFELLIWDDGSTDNSLPIAYSYAQRDSRVHVHAAPHQGIAPSLKAAIAQTTAPYLGWVDSDDKLAPTALEDTIAILNAHPDVGLVYTNHEVIDAQGNSYGLGKRCHTPYSKERLLIEFMTFHFRLMRRSVYEQVGGIDPSFQWAEDYDLCLKLSEATSIYHLPKPLYFYRRHDSNITNNQYEAIRWAQIAIEQAIVRRRLHQNYQLDVQLVGQFKLLPKCAEVPRYLALPLVSVIIPTHNRKVLLDRALQSVLAQTYTHYEIIVVDDASTDGTTAWLQAHYPQIRLITLADNSGAAAARNQGATVAHGQFLAFLDSDDEWHPHYLQRQLDTIAQHPEAVLVYSNYLCSFAGDDLGTPVTLQPSDADYVVAMLQQCFIHTLSQVVLPVLRFRQVGGFDPHLKSCHDWDFYLRLFNMGTPAHCSDFLVRKYWLPNSLVTQAQGQIWLDNGLRVLDLFYQRPENDRYRSLQSTAKQKLQDTITYTHQWLVQGFERAGRITPRVSVILTCLNAETEITDCLHCCLDQTEESVEILVVDRGSSDDTIAQVQQYRAEYPDRVRLLQAPGASRNAAWNRGFEAARGDYIQWLEPSDRLAPGKLAQQIKALEQDRSIDIAVSDWEWYGINQHNVVAQFTFPAPDADDMLLHLLLDAGCPAAAHLLRRSAAEQLHSLQAWHPDAQAEDDREYFTLAALLGLRFGRVAGATVQRRCSIDRLPLHFLSTPSQVQNRRRMFARFQDVAALRSAQSLQPIHWQLLRQNWDLWCGGQNEASLAIEPAQQTVAQALLRTSAAQTLEDHARVILQQLWADLLVGISQSSQPQDLENFALLSETLAHQIGFGAASTAVQSLVEALAATDCNAAPRHQAAVHLNQWLLDVPLFSPLFAHHRLQVYLILDQFSQVGWLVQAPLHNQDIEERQPQNELGSAVSTESKAKVLANN